VRLMSVDFDLRFTTFGATGSVWERHLGSADRRRMRKITSAATSASAVEQLDVVAAAALGGGFVWRNDASFTFVDGDFLTVGRSPWVYRHAAPDLLPTGYRADEDAHARGTSAVMNRMLRLGVIPQKYTDDEQDWYLVPVPRALTPVVIDSASPGKWLTQGIDFEAQDGYIAMRHHPAKVLPRGTVRVRAALERTKPVEDFSLGIADRSSGRKFQSVYTKRTQSIEAFRRAAAEYAGMFVFPAPDYVVRVMHAAGGVTIYETAKAGLVTITYPHAPLSQGQQVDEGYVVCKHFECVENPSRDDLLRASAVSNDISLNWILPVRGLSLPLSGFVMADNVAVDPASGNPHVRLHFAGEAWRRENFWAWQARKERSTGNFLHAALGSPALPTTVDAWDLLRGMYGGRLVLVVFDRHSPGIDIRLLRFLREHRPLTSAVVVCSWFSALHADYALTDEDGIPVLDDTDNVLLDTPGGMLVYDDPPEDAPLVYNNEFLVY
jgi:hypothetical protein